MLIWRRVTLQQKERRIRKHDFATLRFCILSVNINRPSMCKIACRTRWSRLEALKLLHSWDIFVFVMYYVYVTSGPSLLDANYIYIYMYVANFATCLISLVKTFSFFFVVTFNALVKKFSTKFFFVIQSLDKTFIQRNFSHMLYNSRVML